MTVARVTQEVLESVSNVSPNARVSQVAVETVCANSLKAHVTQVVVEMISENVPNDTGNVNKYRQIQIAC